MFVVTLGEKQSKTALNQIDKWIANIFDLIWVR